MTDEKLTFWDHLDVLRAAIIRVAVVFVVFFGVAFAFKEQLFAIVMAPRSSSFVLYRMLNALIQNLPGGAEGVADFEIDIFNAQLAQQFILHMRMAMYVAFLVLLPYILVELFRFVAPGLYQTERRNAVKVMVSAYLMFMLGVAMSYFVVFPLTLRFLGTYQVTADIANVITLDSYIGTFTMLNLMMGIVFELPVLCWLLGKMGLVTSDMLRQFRRHAIVALMIVAAIITPTADVFTLLIVTLPMYLLYEIGILVGGKPKKT